MSGIYIARLVVKNGHQNDTCYDEVGLCGERERERDFTLIITARGYGGVIVGSIHWFVGMLIGI